VAGVIAADANNGQGIVGVAPQSEILALKACWQDPPDSRQAVCNSYTLAQAVDFALREGAQVLNLSLAGPEDPLLARLLEKALKKGVAVVAARPDDGGEDFPASLAGVLGVRSSGPSGSLRAADGTVETAAALAAPGVDVLTTVPRGTYDFFTGSSIAAAQVSGVVALLLERRPDLSPAAVVALIQETAQPVTATASTGTNGAEPRHEGSDGQIVDACRALARLLGQGACEPGE
jgi:subtilisin family serine protease